jgi:uncharacterized membrane protein YqiK
LWGARSAWSFATFVVGTIIVVVVVVVVVFVVVCRIIIIRRKDVWTRKGRQSEGKGEEPFVAGRSAVSRR